MTFLGVSALLYYTVRLPVLPSQLTFYNCLEKLNFIHTHPFVQSLSHLIYKYDIWCRHLHFSSQFYTSLVSLVIAQQARCWRLAASHKSPPLQFWKTCKPHDIVWPYIGWLLPQGSQLGNLSNKWHLADCQYFSYS